jgi:hypothetical protein
MLTIEKCKKILKIENEKISDEEVSEIRNMLYVIAETAVETIIFKENQNENSSNYEPCEFG